MNFQRTAEEKGREASRNARLITAHLAALTGGGCGLGRGRKGCGSNSRAMLYLTISNPSKSIAEKMASRRPRQSERETLDRH